MFVNIDGLELYYERFDGEGLYTVILHGWGCDSSTVKSIFDSLQQNGKSVISIDLPMFGKSQKPHSDYTIYDYSALVERLVASLSLGRVNIIGHSFGGRIALILAQNSTFCNKAIITGGAGLKPRRKIGYYLKVLSHKIRKKICRNYVAKGSSDYNALDECGKKIFVGVVNTHLDYTLKNINVAVLLIWGRDDVDTPLYMAKKMEKNIKDCGLVVIDGTHYAFLQNSFQFGCIVNEFL